MQEIALIENLQREDLNPIEEASGYKQLMEDFELTQEQISQKVSKSRSTVANSLRLLNLSTKICGYLEQNKLSAAHAKILLSITDKDLQDNYAEICVNENLTRRELEKLIKENPNGKVIEKKKKEVKEDLNLTLALMDFEKKMENSLGTKVKVINGKKKGKIEIEYYGSADLERICRILNIG